MQIVQVALFKMNNNSIFFENDQPRTCRLDGSSWPGGPTIVGSFLQTTQSLAQPPPLTL